jgi:hypothetical protein
MTTYQSYHKYRSEITSFESNKFLHVIFAAIFVTAVFIVPTTVLIKFLFF